MGNKLTTNFTPIIDEVAADVGIVGAMVFGVIWRYCQMENGYCEASYQTIADRAHVDRRTAMRHVKSLCDRKYLVDLGAEKPTHPRKYQLTDKARMILTATGENVDELVTESHQLPTLEASDTPSTGDRKSPALVTESHQLTPASDLKSPALVTESHPTSDRESPKESLKRDSEETEDPEGEGDGADAAPPHPPPPKKPVKPLLEHPAIVAYCEVARFTPPPAVRADLAEAVGDAETNVAFWEQVVRAWIACGWSPRNIKGMLQCYSRREVPGDDHADGRRTGSHRTPRASPRKSKADTSGIDAWYAEAKRQEAANGER